MTQSTSQPGEYEYKEPDPAPQAAPPRRPPASPAPRVPRRTPPHPTNTPKASPRQNGQPRAQAKAPAPSPTPAASVTTARPAPAATERTAGPAPFIPSTFERMPIHERMPPHDLPAEAAVLGAMIIDPKVVGAILMFITDKEMFFKEENQVIFEVLRELYEKGSGIDAMILRSTLRSKNLLEFVGGIEYIKDLASNLPTSANAEYYAAIVRDAYVMRRMITTSTSTLRDIYESGDTPDKVLARCEGRIFEIASMSLSHPTVELTDVLHDTLNRLSQNTGEHFSGIATGYIEIDNILSGMQRGDMIIVAARPSVGKTALAMNILEHVGVDLKKPCALFSLEMSRQQLGERMISSRSGVNSHSLRRNMLSKQDRDRLSYAVGELSGNKIFIDDTPALTMMDLRTKARRMKLQHGIELIAVDYLQLMEVGGKQDKKQDNRQQEITRISRGIKALAKELNVPILCLSQLNRSSETEGRKPRTSDLRESGSIEQDADVVMLLHREAVLHRGDQEWAQANSDKVNLAEVIIAKNRMGPCDVVRLTFLGAQTRFCNWNPGV